MSQAAVPPPVEDRQRRIALIDTEVAILDREIAGGEPHAARREELLAERARVAEELAALEARWEQEKALAAQLGETRARIEDPANTEDKDALRAKLAGISGRLRALQGETPLIHPVVDRQAVAEVVEGWTGIPAGRMQSNEIRTVLNLKQAMEQRIVGQPHALEAVAQAIRTSRAGLTDPRKPIGVFLMVGTSGTGKTETALTLADLLYGGEQNVTVINMTEFKEEHKVSLLMGSPPGYVGYGEGGVLTEAVRRRPYSVILLDEMEKAHPGVQDIFFQVFDKGNMKDGEGRDIDFKNTVIIMTSNAGTDLITRLFADPETAPDAVGAGRRADAGADEALQAGLPRPGEFGALFSARAGDHPPDRRAAARPDPAKSAGILWRQVRLGPGTGRHDRRALHRDIVRGAQRREDPLADVTAGTVRGGAISPRRGRNDQRGHRGRGHGWVVSIPHRLNPSNRLAGNKGAHRGNLHEVWMDIDGAVTTTGLREMDRAELVPMGRRSCHRDGGARRGDP